MKDVYYADGIYVEWMKSAAPPDSTRPPLLLVHGAGHGAWCWEQWMGVLSLRGWEAHALSLRGHPASRHVDEATYLEHLRVEDYADDVAVVARHIGRPAVVIGHSMGGIVAQRYVARASAEGNPPAGLVLLASVVPGQLGPTRTSPVFNDRVYRPDKDTAQRLYFHSSGPVVERALARLVGESPSVINEYSLDAGVPIDPRQVRCPVLVVTAEHDNTNVPRDRRIADFYRGDYRHEDIGHDLMLDKGWETVLDHVVDWVLARVPVRPAGASRFGS